ncbi:MAG: DUF3307 domain-containing protein [Elusimicrobia bacterium]|nr:DUF3307 domain-containing protein [Elusimicrobiota bacterium]
MVILWRLMLGHLLADFTFQSNFINAWKRKSIWGMLAHCAMHPVAYIAFTYPYLNEMWVDTPWIRLQGWTCILLIFFLHFIEDEWRVFTIFKFKLADNFLYFAWDQVIHYAVIFMFFPVRMGDSALWVPEKWPVLACLFIMVTHFSTVFIYFLEKDLFAGYFPDFDEKYLTMAERLVLALCFLLPGWWFMPVVGVWVGNMAYLRHKRLMDFSWFSFYAGGTLAALCGWGARLVYYS